MRGGRVFLKWGRWRLNLAKTFLHTRNDFLGRGGFARKQAPTLTDNKSDVYKIALYER